MKKIVFFVILCLTLFSCTSYHVVKVDSDLTYRVVPATLNLLQKEYPSKKYGTVVELDCAKGESESCQIVFFQLDKIAAKSKTEYKNWFNRFYFCNRKFRLKWNGKYYNNNLEKEK